MTKSPAAPTLPTIHLNGTSKDVLVNEACEIRRALRSALDGIYNGGKS